MIEKMSRFFNEKDYPRIKADFSRVLEALKDFRHLLVFDIGENFFTLSCRGNQVIKVVPKADGYSVEIPTPFVSSDLTNRFPDFRKRGKKTDAACVWELASGDIQTFFQRRHLNTLISMGKSLPVEDVVIFEQAIRCDNFTNQEEILIDHRLASSSAEFGSHVMMLKSNGQGHFSLRILSLLLGSNPDIAVQAPKILEASVKGVRKHFRDYKETYERQYFQKKELGLIPRCFPKKIIIDEDVGGEIVVIGYALEAEPLIANLRHHFPNLGIRKLYFKL